MAYKTFANGFPLPASDLNNFLMNQSVIVFADSAARGSAIPSPVTGMLTYLEDTNAYESWNGSAYTDINDNTAAIPKSTVTTSQDLIVADGASSVTRLGVGTDDQVLSVVAGAVAWADAGGGGGSMTLLASGAFPSANVLNITSLPTGYKYFAVYLDNISTATNQRPRLTLNADGTNRYGSAAIGDTATTTIEKNYQSFRLHQGDILNSSSSSVWIEIYDPAKTSGFTPIKSVASYMNTSSEETSTFSAGGYDRSAAITQISISAAGSFDAGNYYVYGVN